MAELLLGAGRDHRKKISWPLSVGGEWSDLTTVDFNPDHKPDFVFNLASWAHWFITADHWEMPTDCYDEIHAYDVMEHIGQQGDFLKFFHDFSQAWRALKPNGIFFGISPHHTSPWAWGDPGHTRVMSEQCITFLSQPNYAGVGKTSMSDYRRWYKADFEPLYLGIGPDKQFVYILQAIKPART